MQSHVKTSFKPIVVLFLIPCVITLLAAIFEDPLKTEQRLKTRTEPGVMRLIDPTLILPYTEAALRQKVSDTSTHESVGYNARKFVNQYPTHPSANETWQRIRRTRKPRMGQQRFWACMHLADHDYGHLLDKP